MRRRRVVTNRRTPPNSRRLRLERLEDRRLLAVLPAGATSQDTAEYLLGDVVVNVVLMESDGTLDASTEDWTAEAIAEVKQKVSDGVQWWEDTLDLLDTAHSLNFILDTTFADDPIETKYEPISRRSNDFQFWIEDALNEFGFNTINDFNHDIREFNNAKRLEHNADWAFTIFVVNDVNDLDGLFAANGTFRRSFAYPGGRFIVFLRSRPISTVSHELSHIFWGRDEYEASRASYTDRRGYLNAQNFNAWDNPLWDQNPGARQPSIMDRDSLLNEAFENNTSSDSSFAMIGWRDSDGDGVFNVLDVPLDLEGNGVFNDANQTYRFRGTANVVPLLNLNPAGNQNDITINQVDRLEYRVDGSAWQTAASYGTASADIDVTVALPSAGPHTVEFRAVSVDSGTDELVAASTVFQGNTQQPSQVPVAGLNGFIWHDVDNDFQWSPGESGLSGWTLSVVDPFENPLDLRQSVEPDDYAEFQEINDVHPGVTLTATGSDVTDDAVRVGVHSTSSTGQMVFTHKNAQTSNNPNWLLSIRRLRMDFTSPVSTVELDAVARGNFGYYGRLEAYNASDELVGRYTTEQLLGSDAETMRIDRPEGDIAYAIAGGHQGTSVRLDALRFGPEVTTESNAQGAYQLGLLPAGSYRLIAQPPDGWQVTSPVEGYYDLQLSAGQKLSDLHFGARVDGGDTPWRNPVNHLDVNNDTFVTALDALTIINELNSVGARELPNPPTPDDAPPPFFDTNGDGWVAASDALMVINFLNGDGGGVGEGESGGGPQGGPDDGPEGEFFAEVHRRFNTLVAPWSEAAALDTSPILDSRSSIVSILPTSALADTNREPLTADRPVGKDRQAPAAVEVTLPLYQGAEESKSFGSYTASFVTEDEWEDADGILEHELLALETGSDLESVTSPVDHGSGVPRVAETKVDTNAVENQSTGERSAVERNRSTRVDPWQLDLDRLALDVALQQAREDKLETSPSPGMPADEPDREEPTDMGSSADGGSNDDPSDSSPRAPNTRSSHRLPVE